MMEERNLRVFSGYDRSRSLAPRQYRALVESLSEGIGVVDSQGILLYCNPAFTQIVGKPEKELLGRPINNILGTSEPMNALIFIENDQKNITLEIPIHAEDEHARLLSIEITPIQKSSTAKGWAAVAVHDITSQKREEQSIRYHAFHDSLTGLYNRTFFEEERKRMQKDISRFLPVSVIFLDVDGLKRVNDTLGHGIGDEILKKAGEIILGAFRKTDIAARVGGDEFCVLLPHTSEEMAKKIVRRVYKSVSELNRHAAVPLSMSVGTATLTAPIEDLERIIQKADQKMYQMKKKVYER